MIKIPQRFTDNNSTSSPTRSIKTIKSKLNNNPEVEVRIYEPPYFKDDPLRMEMEKRARKENIKGGQLFNRPKTDHLSKAGKIMEDLFKKHNEAKQKLNKLKEQAETKFKVECSFCPSKRKIEKYNVGGDVIRRNQMWMMQKNKKMLEQKQSQVSQDLSECTFQPLLLARKTSEIYLKNRSFSSNMLKRKSQAMGQLQREKVSPHHSRGDISKAVFETGKKQITDRIFNLYQGSF